MGDKKSPPEGARNFNNNLLGKRDTINGSIRKQFLHDNVSATLKAIKVKVVAIFLFVTCIHMYIESMYSSYI